MTSDSPRSPSQPPVFWLSLAGAALLLVILGIRLVTSPGGAVGVGILIGLGITVLIVGGFALSVSGRLRRMRDALPGAIHMPIVVGPELATATASLSAARSMPGLQLRPATYAAIAIDHTGLLLVADAVRPERVIEAASATVSGIGATMSGSRLMNCLLIEVRTEGGSTTLPVIPMRLRNPLRSFTTDDLDVIANDLRVALNGGAITPGWPY